MAGAGETLQISADDIVIALIGYTGSGKTYFINAATGSAQENINRSLSPVDNGIQIVRYNGDDGNNYVFLDTPGWDDVKTTDVDILKRIATWLKKSCKGKVRLAGIVYLHRIAQNRVQGPPFSHHNKFVDLCGKGAERNVILVTTMCGNIASEVESAREAELRQKYWNLMLNNGSDMTKFNGQSTDAWRIINLLVSNQQNKEKEDSSKQSTSEGQPWYRQILAALKLS